MNGRAGRANLVDTERRLVILVPAMTLLLAFVEAASMDQKTTDQLQQMSGSLAVFAAALHELLKRSANCGPRPGGRPWF